MSTTKRRDFLRQSLVTGAALGVAKHGFLRDIPSVSAKETELPDGMVQFRPEIEPLVRLLEETPRETLLEAVAAKIRQGCSYQEVLAALQLAGIRNVQPRPSVGFKFHAVLVVNSAHLASQASPDAERWLPIFWALDNFKSSQARDVQEGNWTMAPVDESQLPPGHRAIGAFDQAMENWDESSADVAVASAARNVGAVELFERFAFYGCRDFRSIGHKAIFVANSWRTLQAIGWQHAEPVLRSLAYALLNHQDEPNPHQNDLAPDRPWRSNQSRAAAIRSDWLDGKPDAGATTELLAAIRSGDHDQACTLTVELLNRGVSVDSIYDAIFAASGELLMRQRGIVALHAMTTSNALHFAFRNVANDNTRRLLLLQNVAFVPMFRDAMQQRGPIGDIQIDQFDAADEATDPNEAVSQIFQQVTNDRLQAARQVLAYLSGANDPLELMREARRLVFSKGNDSHDYKFSSAVLEDYFQMSPGWRDRYLAASVYQLRGAGENDNGLAERTRAAFAG